MVEYLAPASDAEIDRKAVNGPRYAGPFVDYDRYQLDEEIDPEIDIVSISAQLAF